MSATFTPEIFTQPFSKISRTSVYETMYEGVSKYFGVFPHNGGECVRVCVCVRAGEFVHSADLYAAFHSLPAIMNMLGYIKNSYQHKKMPNFLF